MEQSVSPEEKKDFEENVEEVNEVSNSFEEESATSDEAVEDGKNGGVKIKEQFTGKVLKLSLAGALIDIGKEIPAVIHISQIPRPEGKENSNNIHEFLEVDQEVTVWVKKVKDGRIELTMMKPLDLEWREIKKDMVVKGTVVRMEKFGVFVEIGAERPGLVHISEMAHSYVRQPSDLLKEGDEIEAQVLEVNRRKKQIKLSMKALQPEPEVKEKEESVQAIPARPTSARAQQLKEGRVTEQGDKAPRRQKKSNKKREEINSEGISFSFSDETAAEAEPTAMEIAIREAMEKAKARNKSENKKKSGVSQEQQDLLARTLNSKA